MEVRGGNIVNRTGNEICDSNSNCQQKFFAFKPREPVAAVFRGSDYPNKIKYMLDIIRMKNWTIELTIE